MQKKVCNHNYTTPANEQGPGRRLTLPEIEALALPLLASFVREYYQYTASGSSQTASHSTTAAAFAALLLSPRILVGVRQCDISTTLFGARWAAPIAVAPTTYHCLAHPRGEAATARGAAAAGCNYCCASCDMLVREMATVVWSRLLIRGA